MMREAREPSELTDAVDTISGELAGESATSGRGGSETVRGCGSEAIRKGSSIWSSVARTLPTATALGNPRTSARDEEYTDLVTMPVNT